MNMIQKILQSMVVKALSNGVFTAVPCPQDGVTNRLKVYVQARATGHSANSLSRRFHRDNPGLVQGNEA